MSRDSLFIEYQEVSRDMNSFPVGSSMWNKCREIREKIKLMIGDMGETHMPKKKNMKPLCFKVKVN